MNLELLDIYYVIGSLRLINKSNNISTQEFIENMNINIILNENNNKLHSLYLEKYKEDKILIGQKYKHQNSNTATPTHVGLFALNNPSIGAIRQDIKNAPCIISRYFNHWSAFVLDVTVNPAKNVANDMTA